METSDVTKREQDESKVKSGTASKKDVKNLQLQRRNRKTELSKHYHNLEEILQYSNATPIRAQKGIGYLCCYCSSQYTNPAELKEHNLKSHEGIADACFIVKKQNISTYHVKLDITAFMCKLCSVTINTLDAFMNHLIHVHKKLLYTDIKSHIIPFKFDCENLRCCVCMTEFSRFKLLLAHMSVHIRNFTCETCNAGFINRGQLTTHSYTHGAGSFKCDHCLKIFSTLQKKKYHIKHVHTKNTFLNKCGHCGASFKLYSQKLKHLQTAHGFTEEYKCKACDRSFATQKAYHVHKLRYHLMERRHECTVCEKSFFSTNELKDHMLRHSGARKYQCDICLKSYGRRDTLMQHLRIHADDRRYKCEHCGQAFVQKCSWRSHMRSKHDEGM